MSLVDVGKALHGRLTEKLCGQGIVFHHVPKCGGTSVTRSLRRAYILSQATVKPEQSNKAFDTWRRGGRGTAMTSISDFSELMLLYLLYCDTRCVAAHIPFSEVAFDTFSDRYAFGTILRDPVERFISNYYWSNTRPASDRRIDEPFEDFLETPQAVRLGSTYVRYFSGNPAHDPFTGRDVDRAIENLRRLHCVGFLDDLRTFEAALLRLTGRRLRIGKENVRNTGGKRQKILSGPLREKVLATCAADQAIWDAVQDLRAASLPQKARASKGDLNAAVSGAATTASP
jgi:hypothetical protein